MVLKVILHRKVIFSPLEWNHVTLWSAALPGRGDETPEQTLIAAWRNSHSHVPGSQTLTPPPHDPRVNQKPGVTIIISPIIIFSFATVVKFKALIKLRVHPSSIWAWENKHSCNESGFKPNSFTFIEVTINSRAARSQHCLQSHGRGSGGNLHRMQIFQGGKQKKNWRWNQEWIELTSPFALYKHSLKPATCFLNPLHSSLSDTHSYTQLEHRNMGEEKMFPSSLCEASEEG